MSSIRPEPFSDWSSLIEQARALMTGEQHRIANAANLAALIYHSLPDLNWAGFYFVEHDQLVVGPFQGQPACVRIGYGRGVCGAAWASGETQRVADVHAFDDHIACDAASRSELVVPLADGQQIFGVLDIDSPLPNRFTAEDQRGFEALAEIYVQSLSG